MPCKAEYKLSNKAPSDITLHYRMTPLIQSFPFKFFAIPPSRSEVVNAGAEYVFVS